MEPTLPPGTLLVVRPIDPAQIRVGDVVTYQLNSGKPAVVTHRITAITTTDTGARLFTLKGDNNAIADAGSVQQVQIRGRVWYSVPWVGYVNNVVNGQARVWIVPLIAAALFLYAGYAIASGIAASIKSRRRRGPRHSSRPRVPKPESARASSA
jgi:signal peptidase